MEKNFEREVLDRLIKIESKLDDYSSLKEKIEIAYSKSISNEEKLKKIEDNSKWLWRTVAASIITGIIGSLLIVFK